MIGKTGGGNILVIIKQLKYFWIYNFVIIFLMAAKYTLPKGSEVALWQWTFLVFIPILFLPVISGPLLGNLISKKYHINILTSIKMSIVIWVTTYLTMCIYYIDCFVRYGLFSKYYNILDVSFLVPACLMAVLFEITCLIRIHYQKQLQNPVNRSERK